MQVVNFTIRVEYDGEGNSAKVFIGADEHHVGALMVATEHMMNLMAQESNAGYDRALELLVEGARKSKRLQ